MKRFLSFGVLVVLLALSASFTKKPIQRPVIGQKVEDFSLKSVDGKMISLISYADAKGFIVVFTCNHCPFAKLYTDRLNGLSRKYTKLGVPLLAINPMDTLVYEEETYTLMQERAKDSGYVFPYLQDPKQTVARSFKASHTPHAFVIWKTNGEWTIQYAGAIDDNGSKPEAAKSFIAPAVDELLAGSKVSKAETQSLGCAINYR